MNLAPPITVTLNPAIDRVIEVPGFTLGAHQVGRLVRRLAAGKGVNVSNVLAELGVACVATGFLGAENRDIFTAALAGRGIVDEFLTLAGRTRENITIADPAKRQETHIRDAGLTVSPPDLESLGRKLQSLVQPDSIVVFSGSLPPGVSPEAFGRLLDLCRARGGRLAVDTSGPALAEAAKRRLWAVKPNREELAALAGGSADLDRLIGAAASLSASIEYVLLSCGAEGAYLACGGKVTHARVELPPSRVGNTVGCGDAFLGGFVAATLGGKSGADALRDAVACGAASACTMVSAEFDRAVMTELRDKVAIDPSV